MSKKTLIIILASLGGVIVIGGLVVAALLFFRGPAVPEAPSDGRPQPGEEVSLDETPSFASCAIVPAETIRDALGSSVESVKTGERSGVIARNYLVADSCEYEFDTSSSQGNRLTIQVYQYTPEPGDAATELFDADWININKVANPSYTLDFPAYYQRIETDTIRTSTMHVIGGPKNFRFVLELSKNDKLSNEAVFNAMIKLANDANYSAANQVDDDIPPAPDVD